MIVIQQQQPHFENETFAIGNQSKVVSQNMARFLGERLMMETVIDWMMETVQSGWVMGTVIGWDDGDCDRGDDGDCDQVGCWRL